MAKEKKRHLTDCQICKKEFFEKNLGDGVWYNYDEQYYSYRGFDACEGCFDELIVKVDYKKERISDEFNSRSLASKNVKFAVEAYPGDKLAKVHNELISRHVEIARNPNWEEENEYRKGEL